MDHCDAIDRLTRQHHQHALVRCMAQLVQEHSGGDCRYMQLCSDENAREFNAANASRAHYFDVLDEAELSRPLVDEPVYREVVSLQKPQVRPATDRRVAELVIPVRGERYVMGLLLIRGSDPEREDRQFLQLLVRVFGNLMGLVHKREYDALTGLLNRQAFEERLHRFLNYGGGHRANEAQRERSCFAILDIDFFKTVNDSLGHLFGDEVLVHFSQIMGRSFRYYDLMCRYGGDEFIVVLRGASLEQGLKVLERFRIAAESHHYPQVGQKTVTIGVVEIQPGELLPTIADKADQAMYHGKKNGRNRVLAYEHLLDAGKLKAVQAVGGDVELF